MAQHFPPLFRRCLQCPETIPPCPACAEDEICEDIAQSCDQCATRVCQKVGLAVPSSSQTALISVTSTTSNGVSSAPDAFFLTTVSSTSLQSPTSVTSAPGDTITTPALSRGASRTSQATRIAATSTGSSNPSVGPSTVSGGFIAGITIAALVLIAGIVGIVWYCCARKRRGKDRHHGVNDEAISGRKRKRGFWYHRSAVTDALPELETRERMQEAGGQTVHEAPDTQRAAMPAESQMSSRTDSEGMTPVSSTSTAVAMSPSSLEASRNLDQMRSPFADPEVQSPHNVSTFSPAFQAPAIAPDNESDRELLQLQEEMAMVKLRRERLQEMHDLREREEQLKIAIERRQRGG